MPDHSTLLLTRPKAQADAFLQDVASALGRVPDHVISPVLRIVGRSVDDPGAVQALVFTSANGVVAFAQQHAAKDRRAFCVGDTTAAAAREAGFDPISADGDGTDLVEVLLEQLHPDQGPVVHITGERVARDIVDVLQRAGFQAKRSIAYDQEAQRLNDTACRALAARRVVAPVFSPRSAQILADQILALNPPDLTTVAISQDAAVEGIGLTLIAPKPTRASMIATLLPLL